MVFHEVERLKSGKVKPSSGALRWGLKMRDTNQWRRDGLDMTVQLLPMEIFALKKHFGRLERNACNKGPQRY